MEDLVAHHLAKLGHLVNAKEAEWWQVFATELLVASEDEVVVLELVDSWGVGVQYKGYHQSQISPDVPMLCYISLFLGC